MRILSLGNAATSCFNVAAFLFQANSSPSFYAFPYFETVDGVLPKNIAARPDGGQWIKVSIGDPDGKSRVFLP